MKKLLLLVVLLLLNGCGYHLRGPMALGPQLKNLYLQTADPYGELAHHVRLYLKMSGVHLAESPRNASAILDIQSENTSEQLLNISGTQQVRQYNLILTVTYQVTDQNGRPLIPLQTASETRPLTINASQMLGSSNQAVSLYQQMRQAIVYDIMSRLTSSEITALLNQRQP